MTLILFWLTCYFIAVCTYMVHYAVNRPPRELKPPPPIIPRQPSRAELLANARDKFDATLDSLESLPLDCDEREAAGDHAKQRLLAETKDILDSSH